jgi:hypothetical protein
MVFDNQKGEVLHKLFCCTYFLNGFFALKNSNILELDTLGLFLQVVFPIYLSTESVLCLQMFLQAHHDLHPHVFLKLIYHFL